MGNKNSSVATSSTTPDENQLIINECKNNPVLSSNTNKLIIKNECSSKLENETIVIFKPKKIYPFNKSLDVNRIQKEKRHFIDKRFQPSLKVLGEDGSELIKGNNKLLSLYTLKINRY